MTDLYYTTDPWGSQFLDALAMSKPHYSCLWYVDTAQEMDAVIKKLIAGLPPGQIVASLPKNIAGRSQVLGAVRSGAIRHLVINKLPPEKLDLSCISEVWFITNTRKSKKLGRKIQRLCESINPVGPIPIRVFSRRS